LELEKAGLVHVFSGANGAHRATRNAFFLTSISHAPQAHGNASQAWHVNASQAWHVNASQARFREKENNISAPPQAAAGDIEKEELEPACPPLTGGSGSKEPERKKHWREIEQERILNFL
jgi:hypothetical protein